MYVHAKHFKEEPEQQIVCLLTGESYVHMEGDNNSIIDAKYHEDSVDALPARFYKLPFIKRYPNGQMRVFGSIE